jgi:hypothetical protein
MSVLTEKQIIRLLNKLDDGWNQDYWLFSASNLHLMRYDKDGERVIEANGGMSQRAIVKSWSHIKHDGGDW